MTKDDKCVLLGVYLTTESREESERSLKELEELAEACGLEVVAQASQYVDSVNPAFFAGKGKLLELKEIAQALEADTLILDHELSGSQMRNIAELTDLKVLDRTLIILDIFARRAVTDEGALQVEIAQLKDRRTRLTGAGKALSRLGGGIGTRGPGETQLETDRRHIDQRVSTLERRLKKVRKRRHLTRHRRLEKTMVGAVIGYTNAGKSTLVNRLCDADLFTMDQVFATLDPKARRLSGEGTDILLVDTVGFVRKLPHHLVEAFAATLDEVTYADFIIEVCDSSDPSIHEQLDIVEDQLKYLKADHKPRIRVFNKIDLLAEADRETLFRPKRFPENRTFHVSAKTGAGMDELKRGIREMIAEIMLPFHLVIPFDRLAKLDFIREYGMIERLRYTDEGADVHFRIHAQHLAPIKALIDGEKTTHSV